MKQGYLRLGDVCEVQNGFAFDSKFFSTNKESGMPLIRIRDILKGHSCTYYTSSYQEEYIVHKGDFLIGMDGDFNIGQWQSEDALLNQRVCRLLPSDKIIPKFIFYFIPTALQKINAETSYATVKHLSSKQIKEILIPNISLTEQQRIVALLDAEFAKIDALKANAEKNLQNAKDLFQAASKSVYSSIKSTKKLDDIVTIINGFAFKSEDFHKDNPIKAIKITNVGVGHFVETTDTNLPLTIWESKPEFQVREGDIIFALTRTIISDGLKVAIVPKSYDKALLNQRVAALSISNSTLRNYLFYYFQTPMVRQYVLAHVNTLMQPNLSINDLRTMPIKIVDDDLMLRIVAHLDVLSEKCKTLQANYEKTLSLCDDLKQALLRKAFNGEI